jgi:hypothetical protein
VYAKHTQECCCVAAQNQVAAAVIRYTIFLRSKKLRSLVRAPGIAAESPQELHGQFRGLAAGSPVFLPAARAKKGALFSYFR